MAVDVLPHSKHRDALCLQHHSPSCAVCPCVLRAQVENSCPLHVRIECENLLRPEKNTPHWITNWSYNEAVSVYGTSSNEIRGVRNWRKEPNVLQLVTRRHPHN